MNTGEGRRRVWKGRERVQESTTSQVEPFTAGLLSITGRWDGSWPEAEAYVEAGDPAMFWQNPGGDVRILGVGAQRREARIPDEGRVHGGRAIPRRPVDTQEPTAQSQRTCELFLDGLEDDPTRPMGLVGLGSFPFDGTVDSSQPDGAGAEWGDFGNGFFFVPSVCWQGSAQAVHTVTVTINMCELTESERRDVLANPRAAWSSVLVHRRESPGSAGHGQHDETPLKETRAPLLTGHESANRSLGRILGSDNRQDTRTDRTVSVTVHSQDRWPDLVRGAQQMERSSASPLQKIVVARSVQIHAGSAISIPRVVSGLLRGQSDTYVFCLSDGRRAFVGATPERLLLATPSIFASACIAGSAPRGEDDEADARIEQQLRHSSKNIGEHQFVVDFIKGVIAQFSAGSVRASERDVLKNRDIQHLAVRIEGERRPGIPFLQVLDALHPTPALAGAPQQEALAWLRTHEHETRGLFGGPVGWWRPQKDVGEYAVGIRSALVDGTDARAYAGCGIVPESDPAEEWNETAIKLRPIIRALKEACGEAVG
ncbi:MAG: isochorismate synthase [Actinomycetaceae bacterium]|nr:isochorismate synthase [Actinomycetaceae bacterium]